MLYGKVLRPPTLGATLKSIDLAPAEAIEGVTVVHDGDFVGCAAGTSWRAARAIEAIAADGRVGLAKAALAATICSTTSRRPRSDRVVAAWRPSARADAWGDPGAAFDKAAEEARSVLPHRLHPARPDGAAGRRRRVEGRQAHRLDRHRSSPPRARRTREAFRLAGESVRVIVPDTGGGFGGKHSGEAAVEAARLAQSRGPTGVASLDPRRRIHLGLLPPGRADRSARRPRRFRPLAAWDFTNYNSGGSAIGSPYESRTAVRSSWAPSSPLRQGSYRALGVDRQHVRPRIGDGRTGRTGRRRPARISLGSPAGRPAQGRA